MTHWHEKDFQIDFKFIIMLKLSAKSIRVNKTEKLLTITKPLVEMYEKIADSLNKL